MQFIAQFIAQLEAEAEPDGWLNTIWCEGAAVLDLDQTRTLPTVCVHASLKRSRYAIGGILALRYVFAMSQFFKHYLGPTVLGVAWDPVWGEMHREAAYIDALIGNDVETSDELERLKRRVATQSRQIEELSTALAVLLRMLGEAKQLDLEILDHRVDAEIELRRSPPEQPPGICTHCGKQRPGDRLSNSPYGLVCTPSCETAK